MTNKDSSDPAQQSLLEQMGGVSGLVSSTLPILVFLPANNMWGLGGAVIASLGAALLVFLWRLLRKENLQPAISGFMGVAICAGIAWFMGDAKGYFLYGIWMSLLYAVVFVISILVKWPLVGVIWKGVNGEGMAWRGVKEARTYYAWATAGWAVVFAARFLVQNFLYNADDTSMLWIARMLMGWPLTGLIMIVTVWAVKKANSALEENAGKLDAETQQPSVGD